MVQRTLAKPLVIKQCVFNSAFVGEIPCTKSAVGKAVCNHHSKTKCYVCGKQATRLYQMNHPVYIVGKTTPVCDKHKRY